MYTDSLMEKGFRYRDDRLWKKLGAEQVFAITFDDGEIGYLQVLGNVGEFNGFNLFIGKEGVHTMYLVPGMLPDTADDYIGFLQEMELKMEQNRISLDLVTAAELDPEIKKAESAYAKAHQITMRRKPAFFEASHYIPRHTPMIPTGKAAAYLEEALDATHALAEMLKNKTLKVRDVVRPIPGEPMLYLKKEGNQWIPSTITAFENAEPEYPKIPFENQVLATKIKTDLAVRKRPSKLSKKGVLQCLVFSVPASIKDPEMEGAYFPWLLFSLKKQTMKFIKTPKTVRELDEELVESFAEILVKDKEIPFKIEAFGKRTYCALEDFCQKTGIEITLLEDEEEAGVLIDAADEMEARVRGDNRNSYDEESQVRAVMEQLARLSDKELLRLSDDQKGMLEMIALTGMMPKAMKQRLAKLYHWEFPSNLF